MVDVGSKKTTARMARAVGFVVMKPETLRLIVEKEVAKGDVFEVARLAGINAAKRTAELILLCHPLGLDQVQIDFEVQDDRKLKIEATVKVHAKTGVEMEALTAVNIAALNIYDMCKSVDRSMTIGPIQLMEKSGGASGHFVHSS